jgi:hypothetical protein
MPATPESLIAEVRAALALAAEIAARVALPPSPTPTQITELGRRAAAAHDALDQITVKLLGPELAALLEAQRKLQLEAAPWRRGT